MSVGFFCGRIVNPSGIASGIALWDSSQDASPRHICHFSKDFSYILQAESGIPTNSSDGPEIILGSLSPQNPQRTGGSRISGFFQRLSLSLSLSLCLSVGDPDSRIPQDPLPSGSQHRNVAPGNAASGIDGAVDVTRGRWRRAVKEGGGRG